MRLINHCRNEKSTRYFIDRIRKHLKIKYKIKNRFSFSSFYFNDVIVICMKNHEMIKVIFVFVFRHEIIDFIDDFVDVFHDEVICRVVID